MGTILRGAFFVLGVLAASFLFSPLSYGASEEIVKPAPPKSSPPAAAPVPSAPKSRTEKFGLDVKGIKGPAEVEKIRGELKNIPGVVSSECIPGSGVCNIEIDPSKTKKEDVAMAISKLGFEARLKPPVGSKTVETPQQ